MSSLSRSDVIQRVLVIGDNNISRSIIRELDTAEYQLHQIVAGHSHTSFARHVSYYESDFSKKSLEALFKTVAPDLLISTTAGGSFENQKRIVDLAIQTGIRKFIPPEFGHDSLNYKLRERLPPSKEKYRTIQYLRVIASSHANFQWAATAVGCILDQGLISGDLGFDLKWQSATIHGTGDETFALSSSLWIGRVVLSMIKQWETVQGKYLYAAGTFTNMNEVINCLEEADGKPWQIGRGDVEECVREGEKRIQKGFPYAGMLLMQRSVLYDSMIDTIQPFKIEDAKSVLKLEGERLNDVIAIAHRERNNQRKHDCECL